MKVAGIVAEYNPFHDGHAYHIKETKRITGADYIVVIMSGDFVQRGEPAITDKFKRTKDALTNGADLVLELPTRFATSNARDFALGSISILDKLNSIDYLSFGSESGSLDDLKEYAKIISSEPDNYKEALKGYLESGLSFPSARQNAITNILKPAKPQIISESNNILGIEYLCSLISLKSTITPVTIKRIGASYNDNDYTANYPSATGIRTGIKENALTYPDIPSPVFTNDFSLLLKYKLLSEAEFGFTKYLDVSKELSDRIINNIDKFTNIEEFTMLLKSKQYTYTRISRCLLHILLNIEAFEGDRIPGSSLYAKILGFRKESSKLISHIGQNSLIPLITKPADAKKLLPPESMSLFTETAFASHIYHSARSAKRKEAAYNEYKQTPIIL